MADEIWRRRGHGRGRMPRCRWRPGYLRARDVLKTQLVLAAAIDSSVYGRWPSAEFVTKNEFHAWWEEEECRVQ